jgi:hypothetical protein
VVVGEDGQVRASMLEGAGAGWDWNRLEEACGAKQA